MSARDDLRAWVTSRATDDADASAASKLIAAFVAEAVRADRTKQSEKREAERRARERIREITDQLSGMVRKATA